MGAQKAEKKVGIVLKDADAWESAHTFLTLMGQGYHNSKDANFDTIEFDKATVVKWYNKLVPDLYDMIEWGLDKTEDKPTKKVQFECPKKNLSKDAMIKILGLSQETRFEKISYDDMKKKFDELKQYFDYTKTFTVNCPARIDYCTSGDCGNTVLTNEVCDDSFVREAYFKNCASFEGDLDGLTDDEEMKIRREIEDLQAEKANKTEALKEELDLSLTSLENQFNEDLEELSSYIEGLQIEKIDRYNDTVQSISNTIAGARQHINNIISIENANTSKIETMLRYKNRTKRVLINEYLNDKIHLKEIELSAELDEKTTEYNEQLKTESVQNASTVQSIEDTANSQIDAIERQISDKEFEIFEIETQRDIDIALLEDQIATYEDDIQDLQDTYDADKANLDAEHDQNLLDIDNYWDPLITAKEAEIADLVQERQDLLDAGPDTSEIDAEISTETEKLVNVKEQKETELEIEEIRHTNKVADIENEYSSLIQDEKDTIADLLDQREALIAAGADTADIDAEIADSRATLQQLEEDRQDAIDTETTRHNDAWGDINVNWTTQISDLEQQIIDLLAQKEAYIQDNIDTSDIDAQLADLEDQKTAILLDLRSDEFDERKLHADRVVSIVSSYIDGIVSEENTIDDLKAQREVIIADGGDTTSIDAEIAEHEEALSNLEKNRDNDLLIERERHEQALAEISEATSSAELDDIDAQIADLLIQRQALIDANLDTSSYDDQINDLQAQLDTAKSDRDEEFDIEFDLHSSNLNDISEMYDQAIIDERARLSDLLEQRESIVQSEVDTSDIDADIAEHRQILKDLETQRDLALAKELRTHTLNIEVITNKYDLIIEQIQLRIDVLNKERLRIIAEGVDTSEIDAQINALRAELNELIEGKNTAVKEENDRYNQELEDLSTTFNDAVAIIRVSITALKDEITQTRNSAKDRIDAIGLAINILKDDIASILTQKTIDLRTEMDRFNSIRDSLSQTLEDEMGSINDP